MRANNEGSRAVQALIAHHRNAEHCNYDNYPHKDVLRHALVTEQGGICCYCMGRIRSGCHDHEDRALASLGVIGAIETDELRYTGTCSAACLGGAGAAVAEYQHCDTRKG